MPATLLWPIGRILVLCRLSCVIAGHSFQEDMLPCTHDHSSQALYPLVYTCRYSSTHNGSQDMAICILVWPKLTGEKYFVETCCSTRLPLFHLTRRLCGEKIEEI